ncbi:protein kinase, partial [Actinomadura sp. NPDC000929]|uniref:serine/threonine-protein kinase n=1 Tax=Actinomadura sp. NPDC000929 TaxID=3154517 RepID=UPI00339213DE
MEGRLLAGRYRLESVVGRGGMGTVWRASDETLDREVAVKEVVLPAGLSDEERENRHRRTLREARASARLNHPGVVTVHDVVDEDGRPWIVMELVRARSLQEVVEEDGPLPPGRVATIGAQIAGALRAAHAIGVLHRDVKPANVLVTGDDRAVLTDFGIAQVAGDATLTGTGLIMGSPAYMSPERVNGDPAIPASDLWALGATLYAATEGKAPHHRSDAMAVLAAVMTQDVPPPRNAGPLAPVLTGLLERDPVRRMTGDRAEAALKAVASGHRLKIGELAGSAWYRSKIFLAESRPVRSR